MPRPSPIGRCHVSLDVRLRNRAIGHAQLTGETIEHLIDRAVESLLEMDHDLAGDSETEFREYGASSIKYESTPGFDLSCKCVPPPRRAIGRPVEWSPDPAVVRATLDANGGNARRAAAALGIPHSSFDYWLKKQGWR